VDQDTQDTEQTEHTDETDQGAPAEEAEEAQQAQEHTEEEVEEIEAERERRLDPDNRPENAVIDNSDAELPTVKHFEELNAEDAADGEEVEGQAGSSDPSQRFKDLEYSEDEIQEMEDERERRLDPENRPDYTEVDNTGRTFEDGHFVDDKDQDDGQDDGTED